MATTVHYEFPRRGLMPAVDLHWYDGGLMPKRPAELPADVELERGGGVIFVGERGILMHETYGENPQLYPQSLHEEAASVASDVCPHRGKPRDELGQRMHGNRRADEPVLVCRPADRGHAPGARSTSGWARLSGWHTMPTTCAY